MDGSGAGVAMALGPLVSREELLEAGPPEAEANRLAIRSSFQNVLEVGFERWGRYWLCVVILLFLGMLCVVIWSQWVYDSCKTDNHCNQPLKLMLRLLYLIIAVYAFQREIIRHLLCYSMMRDGPEEPCRVVLFRRLALLAMGLWPVAGTWMLLHVGPGCNPDLQHAILVIIIYYAVMVVVAVLVPACVIGVMFCCVRHGLMQPPRSANAAPEDLIERLPIVEYDPRLFDDSGDPGTYPASCAICLDTFGEDLGITRVPCGSRSHHAFHTECLRGWLHCARTCPLCRKNLTNAADDAQDSDAEAGIELAT